MRKTFAVLSGLAWLCFSINAQNMTTQTPAPEDTPQPVAAGDIGLAGAPCPDIARFLNVRSAADPSLAPDGKRVAFRTSTTGQPQLWIAETSRTAAASASAPQQITFGESVTFHDWSPDGDWIAYGTDRGGNEREGFYLISPDGTRERELLAPSESFRQWGGWSRDGSLVAYAATEPGGEDFSIYVIDLRDGSHAPRRVYEGKGGTYVASWSPREKGLLLSRTRGEDSNDVLYLDLSTGKAETLFQPQEAALYDSFEWTPDGRGFYLVTNEGRNFAALAFYDMRTRKLRLVETPERDVEHVALSHDGRFLAWTENADGFSELVLRDFVSGQQTVVNASSQTTPTTVAHASPQATGEQTTRAASNSTRNSRRRADASKVAAKVAATGLPRGVINSLEWAERAPRLAIQLSSSNVPGDIWIFDASRGRQQATLLSGMNRIGGSFFAGGSLARVTESSLGGLDAQRFVAPVAVSFPSHDGETIYGLLYMPTGATLEKRPPVVLSVHGGPTAQARPSFGAVHQYLLARGYAVLDLNFRGSTGFGKRFTRLDNGRLRPNAVKDMAAAVDWLAGSGRAVDATRVAVMGGSYGGYMTLAALTQLPEKFRAGVSFVGVSNWITALEGASPELKASDRMEYGDINDPSEREFFRQLSPLTHVANVRAPLLVSHGANDPRDPVTEADQIVRAIRERGGDVEYLRFPDEGHSIRKQSNRIIAYRRVARFLERALGRGIVDCGGGETK
ncbi:MAG TPA: S9 family peptidase [Pyrinomonadaceae bacterium]|jgi:dipeptidyl aminopeptidase/acylaminoacyl peptidase